MESAAFVPLVVKVVAAASLVLTVSLGAILAYHWFRYAMNAGASIIALTVYVTISALLLSGMYATLATFL